MTRNKICIAQLTRLFTDVIGKSPERKDWQQVVSGFEVTLSQSRFSRSWLDGQPIPANVELAELTLGCVSILTTLHHPSEIPDVIYELSVSTPEMPSSDKLGEYLTRKVETLASSTLLVAYGGTLDKESVLDLVAEILNCVYWLTSDTEDAHYVGTGQVTCISHEHDRSYWFAEILNLASRSLSMKEAGPSG